MKNVSILGSTGSIGANTLAVIRHHRDKFRVSGLSAGHNMALLREQIAEFCPAVVSVATAERAAELGQLLDFTTDVDIVYGQEGAIHAATLPETHLVVSAMVGALGLLPTIRAIESGKNIALANKEILVMAGSLVTKLCREKKVRLFPIDSEHSAIYQCLKGNRKKDVRRIILTASGGPFRTMSWDAMKYMTPEDALKHPRWKMGRKVTIDSATMMNKGLEIIEAKWLFQLDLDKIDVYIHPQSIVHSLVEYRDGSVMAQLGAADMKISIAYALSYPRRINVPADTRLDLTGSGGLEFFPVDHERFPAVSLAYRAGRAGGTLPAVMNGANERAVEAFLDKRICFGGIIPLVGEVMQAHTVLPEPALDDILQADCWARERAETLITERIDHCPLS
ncbi:MAG: 1-deoxy-D-xylulose-5-phosphate reductoisomerase [Syntrophobacterales bacterium]|jgi:1-deoxy-D-xylulose-5-phosphate reductoisomerase|nr:1-deoxy-D-xylulose-5-phosphate reductoisomerase [Syntrophobacterales bacterium]